MTKSYAKTPCTIVTGFLGAGKTTLVRNLIETANGRRLAIIVNEFGDVGIDGDILKGCGVPDCPEDRIVELSNGCLCCTVADDFVPALKSLLDQKEPPEHIVIETSGLALPKPLVQAFNWPEIATRVTVDGVVAVVDGPAVAAGRFADDPEALAAQRAADDSLDHDNPLEEVYEDQLLCADLVVMNKSDLLSEQQRKDVAAEIAAKVQRAVKVIATEHGRLSASVLLGLGAAAEQDLAARPSHHDNEAEHDHDDFESFVLDVPAQISPDALVDRIAAAVDAHDVLRVKGFVEVAGKPLRLLVQAVGNRIQHQFERPWRAGETRQGRLVVIGERGLDAAAIQSLIAGQARAMHLLATSGADLDDLEQAVDLAQSPAEIVVLSFSDSDLSALAGAWTASAAELPSLRLASLKRLKHPMSVDLYIDSVILGARAVVVRCLGGLDYWRYGMERIAAVCRSRKILLAALPGDDRADDRLDEFSTLPKESTARLYGYLHEGGIGNAREALHYLAMLLGRDATFAEPVAIGSIVGFVPDRGAVAIDDLCSGDDKRPAALIVFYRASLLAADTAGIAELMRTIERGGLAAAAVAVTSLKDPSIADAMGRLIATRRPAIILNATAFSALRDDGSTVLDAADAPVLQIIQAQSTEEAWAASSRGLSPTDLAMNVVLPELDGRLLARPIAFKGEAAADERLQFGTISYVPQADRASYVARLAARWARLRAAPAGERRMALMLSDYPARGGRRGYAVGLDTSASAAAIAQLLAQAGYDLGGAPPTAAQIEALLRDEADDLVVPFAVYQSALKLLPEGLQDALHECWGEAAADPAFRDGAFRFPVLRAGKLTILLQPDRGSRADRKSGYHDTTVPPRHGYVALYAHLREVETIDALVHLGAHGTLEWLPGKALALSNTCWPEAVLGPLPVIYPFIVNNPGEAMQAKRRLAALTLGHLTPPLAQAGLHGPLLELEGLVEEYAEADGLDRRRLRLLEDEIIARAWQSGLAADCGLDRTMNGREAVAQLDAQLCDIKELAVRDRLHVFGQAPDAPAAGLLIDAIAAAAGQAGGAVDRADVETRIHASVVAEREALLAALDGRRVAAGPAGAPSRGRLDVLPTGRNLTAIDPRAIPTRTAAVVGVRAADEVIRRYLQDHGDYPRSLMLDLWASASLRTGGDDLAQALAYLGVRPRWDLNSNRVTGIDVLPLAMLDRPRIDATLRISGLFRDLFEAQIALFDLAVQKVAVLDEDDADNPLAAARRRGESLARVFGGAPGSYGAVAADLALGMTWETRSQLGDAYLDGSGYSFGGGHDGVSAAATFRDRVRSIDALVHPQDDRERDLLDGEEVADFAGGFAAAAASLGATPALLHLDTSRPDQPKARTFDEEIARVVRGRLTNPRWISGMLAHGYRGVAEIAQGIDALYAFAATSDSVPEHLFDLAHGALLRDEAVLDGMIARNPAAVAAILSRFEDALRRRLWVPRRNAVADELALAHTRLVPTERVS